MKFTYKTAEEIGAMSATEQEKYLAEKRTFEKEERKKEIEEATKEIKTDVSSMNEKITKSVEGLAEEVNSLSEKLKEGNPNSENTMEKQISENKETLKEIAKGTSAKEVVLKADTLRASIANNQQATDLAGVGQLAHRKLSLYDIFPKVQVSESNNNGTIRYYDWDESTIARAAASVAEGVAFPDSTATFKKGSITIEKIGDTLPVSEEFFEDEAMFASELNMFLETNVALEVDSQLCNGDGTSNKLLGLYASIPAYTPVASGITDANIFDLIVKVAEDITVNGGAKYNPDTIIARKSVINQMKLKKDGENNYVLPPFVSADGKNIDGMVVVESNIAPANTLVVCDKRFARIYEKGGVELSKGMVNAQFTEDMMTLKARKRLAFLIRNADKGGFRKVTSISAALTTLAT